jgi:hypothetical protein
MRGVKLLVALVVLGCGGGDSNAPNPAFPNAAGVYTMTGGFDGFTASEASFSGSFTLTQASLTHGTLGGSANVTVRLSDQIGTVTDNAVERASVSSAGAITFTITDPDGSWTFNGTLAGSSITGGRHTLNVPGTGVISGDWTGSRTASSVSAMSTRGAALGLGSIGRVLTR